MSPDVLSSRFYVGVLIVLVALTAATLGISLISMPGAWHVAAGITLALVKASLVVLFFMNAWSSPKLTWIVVAMAIAWLMVLFGLTFCDYLTRGWISHLPGHEFPTLGGER